MAELPLNVPLTSHPIYLRIRGPSVYEDENQRTWLHVVMDTGGDLQVQLRQGDYPIGHNGITTSLLTSSTMPSMWTLHLGSQYVDSMGRFWRIVHHVMEDDMEKMILELMDDS
ncbi:T-cell leukemia/lymphoma protein 1A [Myotis brandtii]|uniref:T-cell leukemia/lymphoma protein 1A n=1 Tax=Myotis brandtii TaxID=109478 RepID=S7PMA7_MYOBR|nr:PREDICTED: protein p13 MTCP-1 [Myotis brandtii]EPQ09422.1 T-cell leukemia/lymphoma protein 1A [Myotis brandtii]